MTDTGDTRFDLADGGHLNYRVQGPEGADWIILSNSLATDMRLWDAEVAFLAQTMRVLRYDTRGHGKSAAPKPPYTFPQLCDDLIALMDHLSIAKADILGISLGGMTALAMAQSHPERVNRVLCCDARADAPDPYKAIWDGNIARLHDANVAALCEGTLARWFTADYLADAANTAKLNVVRDMFNATAADGYEGTARCLQSLDLFGGLSAMTHETLYVTGDQDMAAPVAVMQAMADATPNATFHVISDAAHLSNLEQPDQFANVICTFLGLGK